MTTASRTGARDWFWWVLASYTGLQVLWAGAGAVDFVLHPWAPGVLDETSPLMRLLTALVVAPLTAAIALLVLRRSRGNVVGLCLLLWSTSLMGGTLRLDSPLLPYNGLNTGWKGLWLLPLFFPDGQPYPRRLRGLIRGLSAAFTLETLGLLAYPDQNSGGRADLANGLYVPALAWLRPVVEIAFGVVLLTLLLLIVPSLVLRYRGSDGRTRRQMKWLAWSFGVLLVIFPVGTLFGLNSVRPVTLSPPLQLVEGLMGLFISLAPGLTVGYAILRHQLYDIDVIIRRTLIYSVLTAVLGLAYLGSVLVLQSVFQAVTGEGRSELVTVLSTLGIAALFGPVRGRVQAGIDRRFYRKKYDAARTLAGFAAAARDETDLGRLSQQLTGVVAETMQPDTVNLWLRPAARAQTAQVVDDGQ
jgi:hypothetical protein